MSSQTFPIFVLAFPVAVELNFLAAAVFLDVDGTDGFTAGVLTGA